ncbi:MAG: 30S ribosomal protein S4 [Elusimicrobiaceae bacterium]|nr:30S ribosomal protein S4 [Elusimicrobiaceae bacterium]
MARYTEARCKKCRKLDTKLFLKGTKCFTGCVMEKRAAKQGRFQSFRSKKSEYAVRLMEKQRAKFAAGMTERPFSNLFVKATHMPGRSGEMFLRLLETRLDNVVRRLGFAVSLQAARQLVSHGHVKVNDRRVDVASFHVKPGDRVTLDSAVAGTTAVKQGLEETDKRALRPSFLEYDGAKFSGKLLRWPDRGEMSYSVNEQLIVEFYSK